CSSLRMRRRPAGRGHGPRPAAVGYGGAETAGASPAARARRSMAETCRQHAGHSDLACATLRRNRRGGGYPAARRELIDLAAVQGTDETTALEGAGLKRACAAMRAVQ